MKRQMLRVALVSAVAAGAGMAFSTTAAQAPTSQASAQIPRLSNGKPDLSGIWGRTDRDDEGFTQRRDENGNIVRLFPSRRCSPNQVGCRENTNQNNDGEFTGRTSTNRPLYKPEFWDKVQF